MKRNVLYWVAFHLPGSKSKTSLHSKTCVKIILNLHVQFISTHSSHCNSILSHLPTLLTYLALIDWMLAIMLAWMDGSISRMVSQRWTSPMSTSHCQMTYLWSGVPSPLLPCIEPLIKGHAPFKMRKGMLNVRTAASRNLELLGWKQLPLVQTWLIKAIARSRMISQKSRQTHKLSSLCWIGVMPSFLLLF